MKILLTLFVSFLIFQSYSQNSTFFNFFSKKNLTHKKGDFSIYWGWNGSNYSNSDIRFYGNNYDFTLNDVVAIDRQSRFDPSIYFNPANMTIPQYNLRIGYFIHDKYQLSIGADHMKYVMRNYQDVTINGQINVGSGYDGTYSGETINLKPNFLQFEHTDGLNYENIELRRFDEIIQRKNFTLSMNEGIGVGVLIPKTNTTLLNNERYDQFHLAGYGVGFIGALNFTFFKHFFIQSEVKGGFIHMPDIRTTQYSSDKASQHFLFAQYNVVFGFRMNLLKETNN